MSKFDVNYIIKPPENIAKKEIIDKLFDADYIPGTFMFNERDENPDFLSEKSGCEKTIRNMVENNLKALKLSRVYYIPKTETKKIQDTIIDLFWSKIEGKKKLYETITDQELTDTIWTCLKYILTGDKDTEFHVYRDFNNMGLQLAIPILRKVDYSNIKDLIKLSILAGRIGVDLKEKYYRTQKYIGLGPSKLNKKNIIPLDVNENLEERIERVYSKLKEFMKQPVGIDCRDKYLEKTSEENNLSFFSDDFIEGVFDIYLVQQQLIDNPDMKVTMIPRGGRYGNDLSYLDFPMIIKDDLFAPLRQIEKEGRFKLCKNGPRIGGVNGRRISKEVAQILSDSDVVFFKGARVFEMLQGLKKPTFFAFNVMRDSTESLTGIDWNLSSPVFIYQKPGEKVYGDFRARAYRKLTKGNRELRVASYTAKEYCDIYD